MKKLSTPSFRKYWALPLFLSLGIALFQCTGKDLEFLDPFNFVNNDFENIGTIPTVNDPDPAPVIPPLAQIVQPEITQAVITDITGATSPADITPANQAVLADVSEAIAALTPAQQAVFATEVGGLSAIRIAEILTNESALSAEALAAVEALLANPDMQALFPELRLPQAVPPAAELDFDWIEEGLNARINTLVGPCADAARAAYDQAVIRITQNRDTQLATFTANFDRRTQEAATRATNRIAQVNTLYQQRLGTVQTIATNLLLAANAIQPTDAILANRIRQFAFVYTVSWRTALFEGLAADLVAIEAARLADIANATAARDAAIASLTTAFNAAIQEANNILNTALNSCHNQGTGS
ncbi:MAG: hypothetical protein ACXIUD_10975 [Mongoliitalea sp.]